jgi:hypothetical protein
MTHDASVYLQHVRDALERIASYTLDGKAVLTPALNLELAGGGVSRVRTTECDPASLL